MRTISAFSSLLQQAPWLHAACSSLGSQSNGNARAHLSGTELFALAHIGRQAALDEPTAASA